NVRLQRAPKRHPRPRRTAREQRAAVSRRAGRQPPRRVAPNAWQLVGGRFDVRQPVLQLGAAAPPRRAKRRRRSRTTRPAPPQSRSAVRGPDTPARSQPTSVGRRQPPDRGSSPEPRQPMSAYWWEQATRCEKALRQVRQRRQLRRQEERPRFGQAPP